MAPPKILRQWYDRVDELTDDGRVAVIAAVRICLIGPEGEQRKGH